MADEVPQESKPTIGRPFAKGHDPRRGPGARKKSETARVLARAQRKGSIEALVRLRDQQDDPELALEATKLLLRYSDGEPGAHNVPTEMEEARAGQEAQEEELPPPPELPTAEEAA